jgi:hypothetical protein
VLSLSNTTPDQAMLLHLPLSMELSKLHLATTKLLMALIPTNLDPLQTSKTRRLKPFTNSVLVLG